MKPKNTYGNIETIQVMPKGSNGKRTGCFDIWFDGRYTGIVTHAMLRQDVRANKRARVEKAENPLL